MIFGSRGWRRVAYDPRLAQWAKRARQISIGVAQDPQMRANWLVCESTWFVGVDALPNAANGNLPGAEFPARLRSLCPGPYHKAQVSITYPGYPKPREGESDAAFQFRKNRDAAHVDGVLGIGSPKRRFVREPHAYILGMPLNDFDAGASPMVVWEGSHQIMQDAFQDAFECLTDAQIRETDITDLYKEVRKHVFNTCNRVEVHANVGEAYVLHPMCLHGVAPWATKAIAQPEGRMIAYFRPAVRSALDWLNIG